MQLIYWSGGRGSTEFVRHGEEKAEIEGLFLIEKPSSFYEKASEFGIEIEEGIVILQRIFTQNGKSVCRINGKMVTISIFHEVGSNIS